MTWMIFNQASAMRDWKRRPYRIDSSVSDSPSADLFPSFAVSAMRDLARDSKSISRRIALMTLSITSIGTDGFVDK